MRYVPLTASDIEWPMKRYVRISSSVGQVVVARALQRARAIASRTASTSWPSTSALAIEYVAPRLYMSLIDEARSTAVPMP